MSYSFLGGSASMFDRRLARCAFLASTCLTTPAWSQSASDIPPPARFQVDGNGVNAFDATWSMSVKELSIGPDGPGGLEWIRQYRHEVDSATVDYYVNNNYNLAIFNYDNNGTNSVYASTGFTSEIFTQSGTSYVSSLGDGATLVKSGSNYIMTTSGGTKYTYGNYFIDSRDINRIVRISNITYPSGDVVTVNWSKAFWCPNHQETCSASQRITGVRLESVTNSSGYKLQLTYRSAAIVDPIDADTWKILASVTASNDAVTTPQTWPVVHYSRSSASYVTTTSVTDPAGRVSRYTVGPSSIGIRRPGSTSDDRTITLSGNRVTSVDNDGDTTSYGFTYSATAPTMVITDPLGHATTIISDPVLTLPKSVSDSPSPGVTRTTQYSYDTGGNLLTIILPEGSQVQYVRDTRGNATKTTFIPKAGSGLANIVTSATYPINCLYLVNCNKPLSTTDGRNNVTSYSYDPIHGGVLTVTGPAVNGVSPQTRYTYAQFQAYYKNLSGSVVASGIPVYRLTAVSACRTSASCIGSADETKTTISYGPQAAGTGNNLLPVSSSTGAGDGSLTATTSATYDAIGNVVTSTDPLSHVTTSFFDADRELLGTISPDPDGAGTLAMRATRLTYNPDGSVTLVEKGTATSNTLAALNAMTTLQQVATSYDSAGRKVQDSAQAGGTTYAVVQYGYDAAGRLQCMARRMNPALFSSLPAACTLGTTGSYGPDRITYNSYDNADQLLKVTTGYGVAGLQRDEATYTWSPDGKQTSLKDANSNLTTYIYDGFDRLVKTEYPSLATPNSSNAADYEQLEYDAAGNVTGRRLRGSTLPAGSYDIVYGFDVLNRLSSKTLPSPEHAVTYAYDNLDHPTTITGATTLSYGWDALGRMTSETQPYGSVAYQYDLAGRRTRLTWQDGTYLTYDYDAVNEMTAIHENGATANLVGFTYDDLGERKTRTLANGTSTTYGYDPISRLTSLALAGGTSANTATLSNYSPAGEIGARSNSNDAYAWTQGANVNRAYTTNGLNQFATIAGATQSYDARGNLTSSGGITYDYTSENMLKSVSGGVTLYYDPLNRLSEYDTTVSTRFVYDGGQMSEEIANPGGTVLRRYVFGPAGDEPIVWYEGSGLTTKRYMDQDERGSVTRITDGTGATVNSYDEYGIPGSANQGRFGYTGQASLSEIGLAYYKARMYSPTLGRFMQTDPIGYADGSNWYNYVGSDPVNKIDSNGTYECGDKLTPKECKAIEAALREIRDQLRNAPTGSHISYGQRYPGLVDLVDSLGSMNDGTGPTFVGGSLASGSGNTEATQGLFGNVSERAKAIREGATRSCYYDFANNIVGDGGYIDLGFLCQAH